VLKTVTVYVPEEFTDAESDILRRYFTNLDQPVFALVNLPEVVKGALFARYSRSPRSLRRLFLDEFVNDLEIKGDQAVDATVGVDRAESLYEKVFVEYGDDSVAQLGGVHLACEQASNILTKILEWGRLMSYLEQSTRYISYDERLGGRYRYYRDPDLLEGKFGTRYVGDMDRMFDSYSSLAEIVTQHVRSTVPKMDGDSDFVYRQATRAKALDAVRGLLPASSLSNVGIYGSGQAYEQLLLRMRAHPLPEARVYADMMLTELRKVIPSFLRRVDVVERGGKWIHCSVIPLQQMLMKSAWWISIRTARTRLLLQPVTPSLIFLSLRFLPRWRRCRLKRRARFFATTSVIARTVAIVPVEPSNALTTDSTFCRTTAHSAILTPYHGFARPDLVDAAGAADQFNEVMDRSAALYDALVGDHPSQASYAVSMAYRIRYSMQFNAREAMHMLELRSSPQGHPSYRRVALEMHRLIAEKAGHHAIANAMTHMTTEAPELERLDSERRAESRRSGRS
jgi:thymidylate synthase ThyX